MTRDTDNNDQRRYLPNIGDRSEEEFEIISPERPLMTAPGFSVSQINTLQELATTSTSQALTPVMDAMRRLYINSPNAPSTPVVTTQPRFSFNIGAPTSFMLSDQPKSLFLIALSKIRETSFSRAVVQSLLNSGAEINITNFDDENFPKYEDVTPPGSLTNAPPSYTFVLRQMARRRPRLMGTFIPSPSFVQQTPPPNYAAAYDIYVDSARHPVHARGYNYGFVSMPVVCPECGFVGTTVVRSKVTLCTHMCAALLCLFCCWICAPLPYVLRSCKDVYHYCRNCRSFLGMYCPTNPDHGAVGSNHTPLPSPVVTTPPRYDITGMPYHVSAATGD